MRLILVFLQLPWALMVLYLDLLAIAAISWRGVPPPAAWRRRFAVLIPAHNEEVLLPRLLDSLALLDYAHHLYDVHVVADNCTDGTAMLATAKGAAVHERWDEHLRSKGYALRWLLERVRQTNVGYDAYVIMDADSRVAPNFLEVMNRHLARGDQAIQSYYGVSNPGVAWSVTLRYVALALFNGLRPRGRDTLGLSAGLRGNGMCFDAAVLNRFGWGAFTLAEDAELHFQLVEAGVNVRYAGETSVMAEMPTSLHQASSQNLRWERGRLQVLRAFGPRLLAQSFRHRDPVRLDAVAEQLVPPLSVLVSVTTLLYLLTAALRLPAPRRMASITLLGQLGYVFTGLRLVHAELHIYLTLLKAPIYIIWKLWIYTLAAARFQDSRWVRTERAQMEK